MFARSDVFLKNVIARNAGQSSGDEIRGVDAVPRSAAREIAVAGEKRAVETVLHQIEDVVADQHFDHVLTLCDVEAVGTADILQRHGGAAAIMVFGTEAVFSLEFAGDHVFLGIKEGIESLSGDAGFLADLAHADLRVGLFFHEEKERVYYGRLGGQSGLVASFVHGNSFE